MSTNDAEKHLQSEKNSELVFRQKKSDYFKNFFHVE